MTKNLRAEDAPVPESLQSPEFLETWAEWCAYKRQKHSSVKYMTAERQLKKLGKEGQAPALWRIDTSITNGYQTLWYESYDRNPELQDLVTQARSNGSATGLKPVPLDQFGKPRNDLDRFEQYDWSPWALKDIPWEHRATVKAEREKEGTG